MPAATATKVRGARTRESSHFVPCGEESSLIDRVRANLDTIFSAERGHILESEINNELGRRTDIATWLEKHYFRYHCQLYKRRPIYWHIASEGGSFGALVHYQRKIQEGEYPIHVPWKSDADQPKGWHPGIDDGVKVNIQSFQEAGALVVKNIV